MTDIVLKGLFFQNARGLKFGDTASLTWAFNPATNTLTGTASGSGGVDTANSPNANEFARFTDADTIEGRTVAEVLSDLKLLGLKSYSFFVGG